MRLRNAVLPLLLLPAASVLCAADQLDAAIAKLRMGDLVIEAPAGAKVSVEQVRHEFWFGATLPTGVFTGRTKPEDIAKFKEIFTSHFNAAVIEGSFKWHELGIPLTHPTPTCRFGLWRITREPSRSSRSDFRPRRVAEHTW